MTDYPTDYPPETAARPVGPDTGASPLTDRASDAAQAAKDAGTQVAQTATEKAKDVAHETGKQARDLLGEAREQAKQQAGSQHRSLVDNLRSLGDELGGMTAASEQHGVATELVSQARERVQGAADWLDAREPRDLLDEIRSFARRRPGAFLLGAAMAGVLAGRLTRGVVAARADDTAGAPKPVGHRQDGPASQPTLEPSEYAPANAYETEVIGYSAPAGHSAGAGYGTPAGPAYGAPGGSGYPKEPGVGGYPQPGQAQGGEAWR